ncbi:MAG: hypothetical protein JWO59_219 [Chloroflexi bacterium]|nr:hypothetical protein [Chloroflexota bacterium]
MAENSVEPMQRPPVKPRAGMSQMTRPLSTISGTSFTNPEPAQTLIPAWFVAGLAAIIFGAILWQAMPSQTPERSANTTASTWMRLCKGAWQIQYTGLHDFTVRTIGDPSMIKPECALPITAGVSVVDVHTSGSAVGLRSGPGSQEITLIRAGGTLSVPVRSDGDAVLVDPTGPGNVEVTVSARQ